MKLRQRLHTWTFSDAPTAGNVAKALREVGDQYSPTENEPIDVVVKPYNRSDGRGFYIEIIAYTSKVVRPE